jgi:hypothetical protein
MPHHRFLGPSMLKPIYPLPLSAANAHVGAGDGQC